MFFARLHELACHVADQDRGIILLEILDHVKEMVLAEKCCLFFAGITDTANDSEKVKANCSFVVV